MTDLCQFDELSWTAFSDRQPWRAGVRFTAPTPCARPNYAHQAGSYRTLTERAIDLMPPGAVERRRT